MHIRRWNAIVSAVVIVASLTVAAVGRSEESPQPPAAENVPSSTIRWNRDLDSAWEASQVQGHLLLLYVKTDSCLYCTKMERETYANEAIVRHVSGRFVASSVDGRTYPELVRKLGIRVYPTTVIIGPNAQVLDSISGYVSPSDLQPRLEAATAKAGSLRR